MSTELVKNSKHGYSLTRFYGGDSRGECLQIAVIGPGVTAMGRHVQLTKEAAEELVGDIAETFLKIDPPAAFQAEVRGGVEWAAEEIEKLKLELEEQKQHVRELDDEVKAARKDAAEARAAGGERHKFKEEVEVLVKELAHALLEEHAKAERALNRAPLY